VCLAVVALATSAVGCQKVVAPTVPERTLVVASPVPASPFEPSEAQAQQPIPYFVIGPPGMDGTAGVNTGTTFFTLTNNDTRTHRFELVMLQGQHSERDIQGALRSGDWPPSWARVVERTSVIPPMGTASVTTEPLKVGDYALVGVAKDPKSGEPFGTQARYIWPMYVADPPS